MKGIILALGVAAAAPVLAQQVVAVQAQPIMVQKAETGSSLPGNTEVMLRLNSALSSQQAKLGDRFDLTVANNVMMGEYIVIPRGTVAHGQVTYRTGKGAFGKSAKMEIDLTDIQLGDRAIPVSGHYRLEGQGNTGAAVGAVVAVGVFGAFVTGHSAALAQGAELKAYTREPLLVASAPSMPVAQATPAAVLVPVSATVPAPAKPTAN